MNKIQSVFFEESQLIEYLRVYGPKFPSEHLPTDDEEITFAVWTKRILEAKTGKHFLIAFELKGELEKLMPNFNANSVTDVKILIDKHVKKDTVIDFALALNEKAGGKNKTAFAFQLKIFDIPYDHPEKTLVKKINSCLERKYPKLSQDISLLVIPQLKSSLYLKLPLDVEFITDRIKIKNDSFEKVYLLWGKNNRMNLVEVYPRLDVFDYQET